MKHTGKMKEGKSNEKKIMLLVSSTGDRISISLVLHMNFGSGVHSCSN